MATISFERKKLDSTDTVPADISLGSVIVQPDAYYVPVTIDGFTAPSITLTGISGAASSNKLTSTVPGYFSNVRPGDVITAGVVAAAGAGSTIPGVASNKGSKMIVYPATMTQATLGMQAGDGVTGTDIPAGTTIDRIDYNNKVIYLTNNATDTSIGSIVSVPPLRVLSKNANETELTISENITSALSSASVTIKPGAGEALLGVLRIKPVGSTANGTVSIEVSGYRNRGKDVIATSNGVGTVAPEAYNYVSLGSITLDADEFLQEARVPRV